MLHGTVQINHHEIVDYRIVNVGKGPNDESLYYVVVQGRDIKGYPYDYRFEIEHTGTAPALVALAMQELDRRLT